MKKELKEIYKTSTYKKFRNKTKFDKKTVGSDVYGEITEKGVNMMVKYLQPYFNNNTVFYDLGSGLGKMVLHIGIQYGVKKSVGIEYSKERHQGALFLKENYAKEYHNISFYNTTIQNYDISDATAIYMDNTIYPDELCLEIYNKIKKGCLIIYKKNFKKNFPQYKDQIKVEKGTERTYPAKDFFYLIKK